MARVLRLTERYRRRLKACGVRLGSEESAAVGATLASLAEAAQLPGLLDTPTFMPPVTEALARRVAGRNLWVWYRVMTSGDVELLAVTRTPPIPTQR